MKEISPLHAINIVVNDRFTQTDLSLKDKLQRITDNLNGPNPVVDYGLRKDLIQLLDIANDEVSKTENILGYVKNCQDEDFQASLIREVDLLNERIHIYKDMLVPKLLSLLSDSWR